MRVSLEFVLLATYVFLQSVALRVSHGRLGVPM